MSASASDHGTIARSGCVTVHTGCRGPLYGTHGSADAIGAASEPRTDRLTPASRPAAATRSLGVLAFIVVSLPGSCPRSEVDPSLGPVAIPDITSMHRPP